MTLLEDLLDRFLELHRDCAAALEDLPLQALDWKLPGAEMNSINVLVVHLIAAERFWIGAVALNDPSQRIREEEFLVRQLTGEDLKQHLDMANDFAREAVTRLVDIDLGSIRKSPRSGKSFTIAWCLFHALEHSALHTGHIQLTRQLWLEGVGK